jgi:hypothetical protein
MPGPATLSKDLKELIELFQSHQVEFPVAGAHALAFHGRPRFTEDLDLFIHRTAENCKRLRLALNEFGFGLTEDSESEFAANPRAMMVLGQKPNQIDLMNFLDGVDFETAWNRRVSGELGDIQVEYLSLLDYVATKRATGRAKDLGDLTMLEDHLGSLPKEEGSQNDITSYRWQAATNRSLS